MPRKVKEDHTESWCGNPYRTEPNSINFCTSSFSDMLERLLMKKRAAEKHYRSIIKSVTYRSLSITADSIAAYFFTKNALETAGIVIFVNTYSTILYYCHERIWANIHFGRRKENEIKD